MNFATVIPIPPCLKSDARRSLSPHSARAASAETGHNHNEDPLIALEYLSDPEPFDVSIDAPDLLHGPVARIHFNIRWLTWRACHTKPPDNACPRSAPFATAQTLLL